jgi:hypothetical protein
LVWRQPRAAAAAILVLVLYGAVLAVMPKDGFWSPDEGAKFIQLHSVGWSDGWRYDIAYGAKAIDPEFTFYPTRCHHEDLYPVQLPDGGVKLHWPLWFPLLSGVLLSAFGFVGLYVLPLMAGWLVAVVAGALSRIWDPRLAPAVILLVGLGTPIAFFSLTFWEHTVVAVLGMAALALVATDRRRRGALPTALLLLLMAAALRVEALLFAVAVIAGWAVAQRAARTPGRPPAAAVRSRQSGISAALGIAAVVVAAKLVAAGLPERHRWILTQVPHYLAQSVAKLPHLGETAADVLVEARGNQAPLPPEFLRAAMLAACGAVAAAPFIRSRRIEAVALIAALLLVLEYSVQLLIRPEAYVSLHGLVPAAPVLVFAPYAIVAAWRRRQPAQVAIVTATTVYALLAFAAVFVFVVTADGTLPTGLEWGNRYLLLLYPLGIALALAGVREIAASHRPVLLKRGVITIASAMMLCGVLLEARGIWTLVQTRRLVATWQAALGEEPPVVTDVWWLPAAMAPLFVRHPVECVRPANDLPIWLSGAQAHGVETFTFASFHPFDPSTGAAAGLALERESERVVEGLHLTRVRIGPVPAPVADAAR